MLRCAQRKEGPRVISRRHNTTTFHFDVTLNQNVQQIIDSQSTKAAVEVASPQQAQLQFRLKLVLGRVDC
jgi:hypothetical protein